MTSPGPLTTTTESNSLSEKTDQKTDHFDLSLISEERTRDYSIRYDYLIQIYLAYGKERKVT